MKTIRAVKIVTSMGNIRLPQLFRDVPEDRAAEMLADLKAINATNPRKTTHGVDFFYTDCEIL